MKIKEIIKKITDPKSGSDHTVPLYILLARLGALSLLLNIAAELLSRRSLADTLGYITGSLPMFLVNTLIILFTLSLSLLARRRLTVLLILSVIWLGLGVTNCIVLSFRSSPLSAIDFLIIKSAVSMVTIYLTVIQIILIGILIAAFIAALVILFLKCPLCRVSYAKSLGCIALIGLLTWGSSAAASDGSVLPSDDIEAVQDVSEAGDLPAAYDKYGFAYCFTKSLLSQGVERPDGYDHEVVDDIVSTLDPDPSDEDENALPNIIFVQLESFFDVSYINGLTCSENPIPNFTSLKENGISGFLGVPHIGGGTANIEFEVLTGMNLDHFGFGEYPYTTILKSRACESLAQNLKGLGMSSHALHNHTATFYDRNLAYQNLGFDSFTPIESMTDVSLNPLGWAKDEILTEYIMSALESTDGRDFVFAVSVQGHGRYPSEPLDEESTENSYMKSDADSDITLTGIEDEELLGQLTYYVNQLREIDIFIGELINALSECGEPCIAVFYGDHMPALELTDADLKNGNLYETEYAVWSSFPLIDKTETDSVNSLDRDLMTWQLAAYIQLLCGTEEGDITALHQYELESGTICDEELRILEYAQLYDDETSAYTPSEISFGIKPPEIHETGMSGNTLIIYGDNFNEYLRVKLDGITKKAELIDKNTLYIENVFFGVSEIEITQVTKDRTELCVTVYHPDA